MTENKRFTFRHFDWLQWHIYKNEEFFIEVTDSEEAKMLCDLLNDQDSKIEKFESAVKSAIVNERTDLGRSVLKQLAESLDIDF